MSEAMVQSLDSFDIFAVICYFFAVIGIGLYSMYTHKRGTVNGYFLAGRHMSWLPVGMSLFASNIGSEHFIGLAGSAASNGIAMGALELNACVLLQLLTWVFLPVYISSAVCTLPEYTRKRFGGRRIQTYLALLSLVLYIFTKISVNLYAGALFIKEALHWDIYISVFLLLLATAFCTVSGGLAAVIYTDTLQAFVMLFGGTILTVIGLVKVGGFGELYTKYLEAVPSDSFTSPLDNTTTCGAPRADSWMLLRDARHSDMPWPAFLLGQTPASIWYWCTDQMMVQRALAAKSLSHAQGGALLAGYIKLLPLFIMIIPGMISRVLFTDTVACATPEICMKVCQNAAGCSNIAYPKLVLTIMPTGLRGVMLSVMLAALMSDLSSIFNSASTLFTMDIYKRFRNKATSTRELMIVGRLFVLVMIAISILWIPVVQNTQGGQLYVYIQSIAAYLSPPIAAVYLMAILWPRANEKGAFFGLMFGLFCGVIRMAGDFSFASPGCGEIDTRPKIITAIHYMYFALGLFIGTISVVTVVSLATEKPSPRKLWRTTFWTRFQEQLLETNDNQAIEENDLEMKEDLEFQPAEEIHDVPEGKQSCLNNGLKWFCGMDEYNAKEEDTNTKTSHLDSIKQNPRIKKFLNINAVMLVLIVLFIFAFFSTGTSFGRFGGIW